MCQLTNFGASNEEMELKIGIYAEKLSKISPVGNFDFWSKVNAKKSKSKSTIQWSKSTDTSPDRFRVSGSGHWSSSRSDDIIL